MRDRRLHLIGMVFGGLRHAPSSRVGQIFGPGRLAIDPDQPRAILTVSALEPATSRLRLMMLTRFGSVP
jgi:hypothetical protein